jgi:hypothetical protein
MAFQEPGHSRNGAYHKRGIPETGPQKKKEKEKEKRKRKRKKKKKKKEKEIKRKKWDAR